MERLSCIGEFKMTPLQTQTFAKGFVSQVSSAFGKIEPLRWHIADSSRIYQDEYLEWSVMRDDMNNILRATFTCEGPEVSYFPV